jgi:hypothetical protein
MFIASGVPGAIVASSSAAPAIAGSVTAADHAVAMLDESPIEGRRESIKHRLKDALIIASGNRPIAAA